MERTLIAVGREGTSQECEVAVGGETVGGLACGAVMVPFKFKWISLS